MCFCRARSWGLPHCSGALARRLEAAARGRYRRKVGAGQGRRVLPDRGNWATGLSFNVPATGCWVDCKPGSLRGSHSALGVAVMPRKTEYRCDSRQGEYFDGMCIDALLLIGWV